MKKKSLKSLALNKKIVSNLKINGARAAGESHFNTVCPFCNTDKDLCETIARQ